MYFDAKQFPIRCMLDLGNTSNGIWLQSMKAFQIRMAKRTLPAGASDSEGGKTPAVGVLTKPQVVTLGNDTFQNIQDHTFKLRNSSQDCDTIMPPLYLSKNKVEGSITGYSHFLHCTDYCFGCGKLHLECIIEYHNWEALRPDATNIGAFIIANPSIIQRLLIYNHKCLLLF